MRAQAESQLQGENIRVLFVADKSGFGGVQSIAASMLDHGVSGVELTCFFLRNINRSYGIADLVRGDVVYSRTRWKYGVWSFIELCRIVSDRKIQIVHLNGNKSALYGFLLKKLHPQLKIINHDHSGEFDYGGWFARFIRFAAPRFELFFCVSERRKKFLVEQCAVDPVKVVVINNFVDERRFERRPKSFGKTSGNPPPFVLGFVGRLSYIKGCDLLIRALPLLAERIPGLEALIVGDGPERETLESLARDLGVEQYVSFCGFMQNPAEMYACFDVMVIPSRAEEGPICLYEAWMMGVPVVASDAPVIDQRIRERETGVFFPSGDVVALAERVVELSVDRGLREKITAQGVIEAGSLTAEQYVRSLAGLYRSVLKSGR